MSFHVITEKEEKAYLLACPQPLQDVAVLMIETGMRPDEIYRIRRNKVSTKKIHLQITKGKTKAARRQIHLSDRANGIIKAQLERFDVVFLFPQNDINGNGATKRLITGI